MLYQRFLLTEIQYGTEQGPKNLRSEGGTGWKLGVYEGMNCQKFSLGKATNTAQF